MVKVYLGYLPYVSGQSDWRASAAYSGKYSFDIARDEHSILNDSWVSFDPSEEDIQAGLAIIVEEVSDMKD